MGPGAGLDRCGKSRHPGIRSPDLPVRSESLYRLHYPEFACTRVKLVCSLKETRQTEDIEGRVLREYED
jgi:hypothetical protein